MQANELIVDSFAGGGGASHGILMALGRSPDIAINHDKEAIALHAANHPDSLHLAEDVWHVDPVTACAGRPVGLMWLSPDCKHFSKAKGGKPVSKKIRGLAWVAVRWAKAVRPRIIVLENVEEFQTWGPVDRVTQRPDKERRGLTFKRFVGRLRNLGYEVEWKELRACDYGAPTIRKRLFLIARCDSVAITWPEATHGKHRVHPWRTAAECIQWEIPCPSIFERKKPLAENTQKRIARGLKRFVIDSPNPFIIRTDMHLSNSGCAYPIDDPLRTITSAGGHGIVVPYTAGVGGRAGQSPERPLSKPYQTITAKGDAALVSPTLIQTGYGEREGQAPRAPGLDKPLGTIVGTQKHALVSAFLAKAYEGGYKGPGAQLSMPLPTVTSVDHNQLVAAHLEVMHSTSRGASMNEPMQSVCGGANHFAEVRAFMVAYYGNEKDGGDLRDPMRTVTSKERFGLVAVDGVDYAIADIGMRMLAPRELYRAQGFPDSYKIDIPYNGKPLTKTAQVRMVGNSVCPPLAAAIVSANVGTPAVEVAA